MDESEVSLKWQSAALAVSGITFFAVYHLAGLYASGLESVPSFVLPFEKHIPFLPWMVIPYLSSGVFFVVVFFVVKREEELNLLLKRMLFITLVSGVCFVLFPLRFSFSRPSTDGSFLDPFFQYLDTCDTPFNQAPSLHIAYACLFWTVLAGKAGGYKKIIAGIWLLLMAVSTLTIYQHHVIDVFTALGLVCVTFFIFPGRIRRNKRIAAVYFFAALLTVPALLFLYREPLLFGFVMLWPAATFVRVGKAYSDTNARFLKREDGTIGLPDKIVCAPYILAYKLIRYVFYRNKVPAATEIYQRVFIGPMPGGNGVQNMCTGTDTKVIDLSAELEECKAIRAGAAYYSFPILDIGVAEKEDVVKISELIDKLHVTLRDEEKIYIHCLMGYSRCVFIATLFIMRQLDVSAEEAFAYIKEKYPKAAYPHYLLKTERRK